MNQAHHTKLRAAGWHYDPLSERYSAPDAPLDGTQTMYTPAEAWERYQAAQAKATAKTTKEAPHDTAG